MIILYIIALYLSGSLMFSYWLARLAKKDLRQVGDGNPGAFNLWHSAGYKLGILGVALDVAKGYFPLVLFIENRLVEGMYIIPAALAPILGHVFPLFLRFKGGKAIAVTFGVWLALTGLEVPLVYAIILAVFSLVAKYINKGKPTSTEVDAFMVVLGMALVGIYIYTRGFAGHLFIAWLCNLFILVYTNKSKLLRLVGELPALSELREKYIWFKRD